MCELDEMPATVPPDDGHEISLHELLTTLYCNEEVTPALVTAITKHASLLSANIINNYKSLNGILLRFEGLIRKRWWKKTVAQRREVLLQVWPDMPERHRADYFECRCHGGESQPSKCGHHVLPSNTRIWPYIYLEDLTKPRSLLVFLNSRGRNIPMDFAPSDATFSPLAEMSRCIVDPELQKYQLFFGRDLNPSAYGQTVLTDENVTGHKRSTQGYYLCMRPSLQILRVQAGIMDFLLGCSKEFLESPIMSEPPREDILQQGNSGHLAFSDAVIIAPYRKRESVDFGRLQGYIGGLFTNAKDHLLALREDPSYLSDVILDWSEHSVEMVPDAAGRISPNVDSRGYIDNIARRVVSEAYMMLGLWHELADMLEHLAQIDEENTDKNCALLMDELECKFRVACFTLKATIRRCARGAPTMRRLLIRQDKAGRRPETVENWNVSLSGEESTLVTILDCFDSESEHQVEDDRLFHLLDITDVLFRRNKRAKALLSPTLTKSITDISLVAEYFMQISVWKDTAKARGLDLPSEHDHDENFVKWMMPLLFHELPGCLVIPACGRLRYPVHKARTHGNINTMRTSENNLGRFWEVVDQVLHEKSGVAQHDYIRRCLEEGGPLRRTPEWTEQKNAEAKAGNEKGGRTYQPLSQAHHDKNMQITGVFNKLAIEDKSKPKTKGVATSTSHVEPVGDLSSNKASAKPQKHIALDKRAYKAMKALFHVVVSDADEIPKSLKRNEFTRAMVRVGFSAEKLQGSAWQFAPTASLDFERGVQFHEPHPDSDIPHTMARRFGRRLERVYGWTGESFRLA